MSIYEMLQRITEKGNCSIGDFKGIQIETAKLVFILLYQYQSTEPSV